MIYISGKQEMGSDLLCGKKCNVRLDGTGYEDYDVRLATLHQSEVWLLWENEMEILQGAEIHGESRTDRQQICGLVVDGGFQRSNWSVGYGKQSLLVWRCVE